MTNSTFPNHETRCFFWIFAVNFEANQVNLGLEYSDTENNYYFKSVRGMMMQAKPLFS